MKADQYSLMEASMYIRIAALIVAALGLVLGIPSSASAQDILGTAQSFGVLGGSTVTNTGATVVTGNLGVSPGTAITGFPPGVVVGATHAADAVAANAQSDALVAYNSLAGSACNTDLTGQDLGGLTLTPGVYCFSSSAQLTGTLTLDAMGDDAAVFVFQIGTALTTASNSMVLLTNGGSSCNVFWQIGSSASVGTTSTFVGNILASASITLTTNVVLAGRALALNGAVTMDTNTVTVPVECDCRATEGNYGQGWPGTNGVPGISASNTPVIGSSITISIQNSSGVPTTGVLLIGSDEAAVPSGLGGTFLVAQPWIVFLFPLPANQFDLTVPITANHTCDNAFFVQALQSDSGASMNVSFTPGLKLVLGY